MTTNTDSRPVGVDPPDPGGSTVPANRPRKPPPSPFAIGAVVCVGAVTVLDVACSQWLGSRPRARSGQATDRQARN